MQPVPLSAAHLHESLTLVAALRPDGSTGEEVVAGLQRLRDLSNWIAGRELALTAGLARIPLTTPEGVPVQAVIESPVDVAVGEVGALHVITPMAARRRVEHAVDVTRDLPVSHASMSAGNLDPYRVRIIAEEVLDAATADGEPVVPASVRAEIEDAVVPVAHTLSPSRLRARLRREIARRCTGRRALAGRPGLKPRVDVIPLPGGVGHLSAVLPADAAALAEVTLETLARALDHPSTGTETPVMPFARRANQSDASWRAERRQWARAEALSAIFRSIADARPLPFITPPATPPAQPTRTPDTGRTPEAGCTAAADGTDEADLSADTGHSTGTADSGPTVAPDDAERPTDWPYTVGGLDFPHNTPTDPVLGWWWPPVLPTRHGRAPHLNLTLALTTLQGRDDEPGDLAGYGPIPADLARTIATQIAHLYETASFTLLATDPDGTCVHTGTRTTYRPSQHLRDRVTTRHPRCRAPGCTRPSIQCDLDHRTPHAEGGPTCEHNCDPLCRFHHRLKTLAGWTSHLAPPDTDSTTDSTTDSSTDSSTDGTTDRPTGTLEWITRYGTKRYVEPEPLPGTHTTTETSTETATGSETEAGTEAGTRNTESPPPPF